MSVVCERGREPTVTGSLANEFDFAGQQTDGSTGLQYLRARYYDPATGVFLSREPLERLPGWTGNPFGYAGANPARYLDPTGLVPVDSDGCRDNDTGCQRRVQAESEGACAGLYFYTYTYCKERVPFSDWTLIGEYTLNGLLDLAKFWQSGLEAVGEGEIREAEFAATIGPRMHACALDFTCSSVVAAGLMSAAAVLAVIPGGQGFAAAITAAGLAWETYSFAVQSARPPTSVAQDR
jgi:RHS repeat-associated protein